MATAKKLTKVQFIEKMTALAKKISKENKLKCDGMLSGIINTKYYSSLKEWLRFIAWTKDMKSVEIDFYPMEKGGKILPDYCQYKVTCHCKILKIGKIGDNK